MTEWREFWELILEYSNGMELAQTGLAFLGLLFSLWALVDTVRDAMSLRMRGKNGARAIVAADNTYTEIERIGVQLILFLIGFVSIFVPPPFANIGVTPPELLQHTLTRMGLITITIWKVGMSIRARHSRIEFHRQITLEGMDDGTPRCELAPPPGMQEEDLRDEDPA